MSRYWFFLLVLIAGLSISSYMLLSSRPGICCNRGCSCNIVRVKLGNCCCDKKSTPSLAQAPPCHEPIPQPKSCCPSSKSEEAQDAPQEPKEEPPTTEEDYDQLPCDGGRTPIHFSTPSTTIIKSESMIATLTVLLPETIIPPSESPPVTLLDKRLAKVPIIPS